jgi:monoamine oxidase
MSRNPLFSSVSRLLSLAAAEAPRSGISRRDFLSASAGTLAAAATARWGLAAAPNPKPRIAIIGAGLAGLVCADTLRRKGLAATLYEASNRVGGRCHSLRNFFPGQTAELGGEFIDTTHHTMRSYAVEFKLAREDVTKEPGEVLYDFGGLTHDEDQVVDEFRLLVPRMKKDIKTLSAEPSFFSHTPADVALDSLSLRAWLETRAADLPLIREVLDAAYIAEYGLETTRQSCLNFLLFAHADRRRKFMPFGNFSDERFHLVGGNDAIATRIAARLPGPIIPGQHMTGLGKNQNGEFEIRFAGGNVVTADFVVVTIPFSVLRSLELDASLGLSPDKRNAINTLGYGDNVKTMIGFDGRPWEAVGGNGAVYSDRPNLQATWETNASKSKKTSILTDYASGPRGRDIGGVPLFDQVTAFLGDLDAVIPGASEAVTRPEPDTYRAVREHWPSNPLALGSYTCYEVGQFTSVGGLEAQPAGRLKFAGEHTDSFYSWQGFMEGACLSGIRAAAEILADLK